MIVVTLNYAEVLAAGQVGLMRNVSAIFGNRQDDAGKRRQHDWHTHIEGACKEYATAKFRKTFWHMNVGGIGGDDVGSYRVRGTDYDDGKVRLQRDDPADKIFILVTGRAPHYAMRGWLKCGDGQREEFWCDPTGTGRPSAFFVPQLNLNPIDTLP
jgi:hypothetical protein